MQRSRSRKLARLARESTVRPAEHRFSKLVRHASIGAAVMAAISAAHAQTASPNTVSSSTSGAQVQQVAAATPPNATSTAAADQGGLQEVIVTATKEAVNNQALPMTVTAITGAQLTNQNVQNFQELAIANPQIQYISSTPVGSEIYMRGINGTGNSNTGGAGSVSVYLNGQPITLVGGQENWHVYDMARVETLPGPQGTLYGAVAEAGTVREITNKPDLSHFSASYTTQLNTIYNGTLGGIAEGFVNVPFTSDFAGRFVGWYERDSGFINNVHQTLTLANGFTLDNAPFVKKDFNPVTVEGGRAMFTYKINDNWSINPTIMSQETRYAVADNQEEWKDFSQGNGIPNQYSQALYGASTANDSAVDYAIEVLGKIGDFNVTLDSGYMHQDNRIFGPYMDYTIAYQSQYEHNPDLPTNPLWYFLGGGNSKLISNELHVTTPSDWPVHGIVGLYQDRGEAVNVYNDIMPGLDPTLDIGYGTPYNWPNTTYTDDLLAVDQDWAAFAQMNWDITSHLTATAGFRRFRYKNTVQGFYGFSENFSLNVLHGTHVSGQEICFTPAVPFMGAPCQDEDEESEAWGSVPLFSLSYKFDPDHLVYLTFSKGFRPGGPNRTPGVAPYNADFLTNYEIGWKTAWFDHHLIFDGDAFIDVWKDYQFSFHGANSVSVTANAGNAESKGWDEQLQWLIVNGLTASLNVSYADAFLTSPYCSKLATDGSPITTANCVGPGQPTPTAPLAPNGARLAFDSVWSGYASLRYTHPFANGTAFVEGDQSYRSYYWTNLEPQFNAVYGQMPSYGLTNLSLGLDKNNWELELLVTNLFNRDPVVNSGGTFTRTANFYLMNTILPPRLIGIQWNQNF